MTKTLHRARGLVQDLIVTRKGGKVILWSAKGVRHTVFDIASPHLPGLEYARNLLAALAFCPETRSCLVLGLGGGSIPRMMVAARPQIEVDAVEIDPAVVELAARYFDIRALPRLTIHLEDAASFLRHCTAQYGIVVVDTYIGEQLPDQCATRDFIRDARKHLLENGVLAINWLSEDSQKRETLLENLKAVFEQVWQLPSFKSRNLLYFAPATKTTRQAILSAAAAVQTEIAFENSLRRLAQRLKNPL